MTEGRGWGRRHSDRDVLAVAVEAAGLGAWDVDLTTGEQRWSVRMRAMHGVAADTGQLSILDLVHPEDRARVEAAHARLGEIVARGRVTREERTWLVWTARLLMATVF